MTNAHSISDRNNVGDKTLLCADRKRTHKLPSKGSKSEVSPLSLRDSCLLYSCKKPCFQFLYKFIYLDLSQYYEVALAPKAKQCQGQCVVLAVAKA
jgi:hypothetical protein